MFKNDHIMYSLNIMEGVIVFAFWAEIYDPFENIYKNDRVYEISFFLGTSEVQRLVIAGNIQKEYGF